MRRIITYRDIVLSILFLLFVFDVKADTHTITFNESDFRIIKRDSIVAIVPLVGGYYYEDSEMSPELPLKNYWVEMNGKYMPESFTYEVTKCSIYDNVYISKKIANKCFSDETELDNVALQDYYEGTFPTTPISYFYGSVDRKNNENSCFVVSPYIYDAGAKTLYFISSITFSFSTNNENVTTQSTGNPLVDYLIVTSSSLHDSFIPLRNWKTKKGVKAEIKTLESIYNEYTGITPQEKIKRCLHDYYLNRGLQWVLLGGDDTVVPVQNCLIENVGRYLEETASDLYYACFDGSFTWNADGDNIYAEINDNVNLYAHIKVSRLPIRTEEHVNSYVTKLINYEKNPPLDAWSDRILLMGNKLWGYESNSGYSDGHYKTELLYNEYIACNAPHMEKYYLYDTENNLGYINEFSNKNLINSINSVQPHFLHVLTHGNAWGWSTSDGFFNGDSVPCLNNKAPMVVVTLSCLTNKFDYQAEPSLSEAMIRREGGGALVYWGATHESIESSSPTSLGTASYYGGKFWKNLLEKDNRFGNAVNLAKKYYISSSNRTGSYRWMQLTMNAVGDAEVPIFTQIPKTIDDADIHVYPMSVTVTTDSTAYIAITSTNDNGNSVYKTANTTTYSCNNGGTPVSICLTRKNYVPLLIEGGGIYESMGYACLYLQNGTFPSSSTTYHAENAYIGSNGGNVVVENSGELVIDSDIRTVVYGGLHCKKGGKLVIK